MSYFENLSMLWRTHPIIQPGEFVGNMALVWMLYCTWGEGWWWDIVWRNYLRFLCVYGIPFLLFYKMRITSAVKFGSSFETPIWTAELKWTTVSVCIAILYDLWIRCTPFGATTGMSPSDRVELSDMTLNDMLITPFIFVMVDVHHYFMHRSLHGKRLYFSALPIVGLFFSVVLGEPLHRFHYALIKGLLDFNPL